MASEVETYTDPVNLKVRELLKEVHLDYSPETTKYVHDVVSSIKEAIDQIPENLQVLADVASGFVRDIGADKVEFQFKKPKSIEIGGSYSIQCIAKPDVNIDLLLRLPKECFHEKDYLNHRYHAKRCLYLCIIKKYLNLSSSVQNVRWSTFQNEARKPILVVYPAVKLFENPGLVVRIIPTATSLFSVAKLNLERNNVRAVNQGDVLQATPKYNSSILEDMFLEDNTEFIRRTFLEWKELREALILLKVWARQRSSIYAHDCLNGSLISIIMAYLATKSGGNRINNSMNAMQILRVTLDFIANSKLWDQGLLFQPQGGHNISKEQRGTYLWSFPIVISDPFAGFNLVFRMTKNGFQELRGEAALALICIDKCKDGGFDEIFLTKIDFPAKYDCCIRLNLKGNGEVSASGFCLDDECWRSYEQKVLSLMHRGLTKRAKFVRVIWRNTTLDCNFENGLAILDREPLFIGILVSSTEEAFKKAIMGPSPENKDEALEFRNFWGDIATLRQFRDGEIAEAVVWEHKEWERHLIIKEIIEHILSRHLSLSEENICTIVDQLDFSLLHGNGDPKNLLDAFDDLSKRLRLLNDIPLKISSVQPLDSAFRLTSVFTPTPHPLAYEKGVGLKLQKFTSTCIQPLEVMIQLEGSGNWPMDDVAIEKTKSAFLLRIGESLQSNWGMTCIATENDVDVFMSGYAFRLKILHEKGLSLLKRQIGGDQAKRVLCTDKQLFLCGQHSSMINGLHGRYSIYGPVVRLAKRWVSAHLFSASLTDEAIELLVAYLFLNPLPFYAPSSRISGFLRFLRLLSEYDWAFSPLVVDINGDLTPGDKKEINEKFMLSRKGYEENMQNVNPAMFLATAYDQTSEAWTRSSPTQAELRRLMAYARSSVSLLTKLILQDQPDSYRWECIFRTPLNNYDAAILLHRDKMPYPSHLLFPSELNQGRRVVCGNASKLFNPFMLPEDIKGSLDELKNKLMVNFDPVRCFVGDLEKKFPNRFKVWYDSLGGDAIGLTWEKAIKKRERGDTCEEEKDLLDALKAVGEVGKGFVRSIHLLKAPRLS
ncbi:unnamed protein product [Ilex paraguariensis]|uniref:Nucleolar protein 6 n=1 Tax=Ilex paraguariensis TaxID=185542 RepID=A0ABC8SD02_9AQUA